MSGLRYGDRAIRHERDPEGPGLEKGAPPYMDFNDLRAKVTHADVLYRQLRAERVEAERMENDALIALKEAQAAFDRHVQEFRATFPDSSLWGQ